MPKSRWIEARSDSKVRFCSLLNLPQSFMCPPSLCWLMSSLIVVSSRTPEDTHRCRSPLHEPAAQEDLWPLRQRATLRLHWGLQDSVYRRQPGHHPGEHGGRVQRHRTRGEWTGCGWSAVCCCTSHHSSYYPDCTCRNPKPPQVLCPPVWAGVTVVHLCSAGELVAVHSCDALLRLVLVLRVRRRNQSKHWPWTSHLCTFAPVQSWCGSVCVHCQLRSGRLHHSFSLA